MNLKDYRNLKIAKELMGETKSAEFGEGFVQQLVYFAGHFENEAARQVVAIHTLVEQKAEPDKVKEAREAGVFLLPSYSLEKNLAHAIQVWANGASDHLYDIVAPEKAPEELKNMVVELQSLGLEVGHGFHEESCTWLNFQKLIRLTREIAGLVDLSFGVLIDEGEYK